MPRPTLVSNTALPIHIKESTYKHEQKRSTLSWDSPLRHLIRGGGMAESRRDYEQ